MKCPKCDSEMVCDKTTMGNPPQLIYECKNCGTLEYSKMVDFYSAQIVLTEIAFTCAICEGSQPCNYFAPIYFPVCDKCRKDLKDFVLSKRQNIHE